MESTVPRDGDNIISVITGDHRQVERVFAELENGAGTAEHRRDLADHMTTELVRHSVAEEMYLYPAARRSLPDGDAVADREIAEHAEVERTLEDLEGVDATDPRFDELVGKVITDVRHHVADEEQQLLPRLQDACSTAELDELGTKVVQAKASAPTRPHPSAAGEHDPRSGRRHDRPTPGRAHRTSPLTAYHLIRHRAVRTYDSRRNAQPDTLMECLGSQGIAHWARRNDGQPAQGR